HRPGRDPAAGGRGRRDLPAVQPAGRADRADRGAAVRVVIAEDNALLRDGLELLLTHSVHEVTAAVDNAPALLAALAADRPDVVVVDVRLPPPSRDGGLRAAAEARRPHPGLPVLVLSQYVERTYAIELLADGVGAVGYLLKDRGGRVDEFLAALCA